jgi:hypothetical protein
VLNVRASASFAALTTAATAALVAVSAAAVTDTRNVPVDVAGLLVRVGERVEAYYARAQSILCLETVHLQHLDSNFASYPYTRRLVYELRVSREPATDADSAPEANVLRQLRTVDGRPPKPNEEPGCLDPKPVSLDPLSFLLPHHQRDYKFSYKGSGRSNGRAAVMVDYRPVGSPPAEVTWHDSCVSIDVPARTTGRVWIDAATGDVLRIDERVIGPFDISVPEEQRRKGAGDWLVLDRADSTIRYKAVAFTDPDELVLLPASIESMTLIRGSGAPRLRTTQAFTGYQRFVTGARIVP